jgi:hypothetical protein
MRKQMLILTGPQGSGNHLWSKVFSLHSKVYGWKSLLENYWEPHRFNEPFAEYWRDPSKLSNFDWSQSHYYFTSISVPLGIPNSEENPLWAPDIKSFIQQVEKQDIRVVTAVIGRDQNILNYQQTRIRTESTLPMFEEQLETIKYPRFLSYELLYLYGKEYLKSVALDVNIPVAWDDPMLDEILAEDSNAKYVHSIDNNELDMGNKKGIIFKHKP